MHAHWQADDRIVHLHNPGVLCWVVPICDRSHEPTATIILQCPNGLVYLGTQATLELLGWLPAKVYA